VQVIVAHTFSPGVVDSSEWAVAELGIALKSRGHEVEDIPMPFDPGFSPLDQLLGFRLYGPIEHGDVMVTLHPPCHLAPHRRKVIWGIDRVFRSEDLMPSSYFTADAASRTMLESLRASDRRAYAEARRVCLRSSAGCEKHFRETGSPAVFLPLPPRRSASSASFEPILAARTEGAKPALLLTAMEVLASLPASLRLVLFGPQPFSPAQWSELVALHRLHGRLELRKASAWPSALPPILAVLDLSCDPDLLGQNTIDAHGCEKPVIAFDSSAAREWIGDGENGLIVNLDPVTLKSAVADLAANPARAHALGLAGKARLVSWGAHWDHVVETLTQA